MGLDKHRLESAGVSWRTRAYYINFHIDHVSQIFVPEDAWPDTDDLLDDGCTKAFQVSSQK